MRKKSIFERFVSYFGVQYSRANILRLNPDGRYVVEMNGMYLCNENKVLMLFESGDKAEDAYKYYWRCVNQNDDDQSCKWKFLPHTLNTADS